MDITDQYMKFLSANYPDIAGRLDTLRSTSPTGNTPEEIEKAKAQIDEEIKTLANDPERVHRYEVWEKVPSVLRDRYDGRVPPEIMEAAERDEIYVLREMEYHPEKRNVDEVRAEVEEKYNNIFTPEDIVTFAAQSAFAAAIVAGYSQSSSAELARCRMESDNLSAQLDNPNLTDEEKQAIHLQFLALHKRKHDVIKKDWGGDNARGIKPNQPEKLLVHMFGKFHAGKMDKKELVAIMADLQPHLKDRQPQLLEYLQRKHVQAKIGRFDDKTRDLFAQYVLNELPDNEQSRVMEDAQRYYAKVRENLTSDQKAIAVAKNISAVRDNILPRQHSLSAQEKRAAMPSALNQGNERTA